MQFLTIPFIVDCLTLSQNVEGFNKPLSAPAVSYLDILPEDNGVIVGVEKILALPEGTIKDGRNPVISALRLPDGSILLKACKFNHRFVLADTAHDIGRLINGILGKASQLATIMIRHQFDLDWTTYRLVQDNKTKIWSIQDIGRVAIEFAFGRKDLFAVIAEGRLTTVDWITFQDYLAKPIFSVLADIVMRGITIEPGFTLIRGNDDYLFVTDGRVTRLYDRQYECAEYPMQGYSIIATIDEAGAITNRFTMLTENNQGITVDVDVDPRTRNDKIFRRFNEAISV